MMVLPFYTYWVQLIPNSLDKLKMHLRSQDVNYLFKSFWQLYPKVEAQ